MKSFDGVKTGDYLEYADGDITVIIKVISFDGYSRPIGKVVKSTSKSFTIGTKWPTHIPSWYEPVESPKAELYDIF